MTTEIPVTEYIPPNGKKVTKNAIVDDDVGTFFSQYQFPVTCEVLSTVRQEFAIYCDIGMRDDEGEPIEIIMIESLPAATDVFNRLKRKCEMMMDDIRSNHKRFHSIIKNSDLNWL